MILDTTFFVDFFKSDTRAIDFVHTIPLDESMSTSMIVLMEVHTGTKSKNEALKAHKTISSLKLHVYSIDEAISNKAYELYTTYFHKDGLGIADSFIAATALVNNETLITSNLKHFKNIKSLKASKPY